jgi:ComF family protein
MFLTKPTNRIVDGLLALVYPQCCVVCQRSVERRHLGSACAGCWEATHLFNDADTICWKCGAPSLGAIEPQKRTTVRCRRCDDDYFTAARACGAYEGALRAAVLGLKREADVSPQLLNLLAQTQRRSPLDQATRVLPVPLHPSREKERGFNQASVLGRQLARRVGLPFDDKSLIRTSHSGKHRAGMDATGRRSSVASAFAVSYPRLIAGERVLLVDDVFTTGATVSACAAALIASGASEVYVLTIARAVHY